MKNLKNLGKTLNKNEQKEINGGMLTVVKERDCRVFCVDKPAGTFCKSGHCEYQTCDGNGGVIYG